MAANVHVPTRIKVDADTLDHPGLDDALGAATDRALQNAADVLPASRLVTHGPVEVAWTGPGAADVSSATKADVEQRIQAVVATVAKKAPSGRRSSRRPRRWTVVKVVPFRARLGPLVGFFRELGGGLEDVTEVYSGQLDQPVAATARVVQVRSRAVVGSVAEEVASEVLASAGRSRHVYGAYSTDDSARQRLVWLSEGLALSGQLPSLRPNEGRVFGDGPMAVLGPGGLLLVVTVTLPEVHWWELARIGDERVVEMPLRDLDFVIGAKSFERLFGVSWEAYTAELGDVRELLRLVPVTPAREVEGRTLSAVVEDFVLRQYAADVAVFGRLHLLTAGYLSSVPLQAAAALLDLSDAATRQLPADSATGRWARGWKGAYVYAAPSVDRSSVLRARYHAKARAVAADLVTLLQESTKNYLWGARIFTLLRKRYGSEPGEPAEFELLLEELKAQGFFDALFDAGDSTGIGLDMYLVRFSRGTRYQDDPRIKQSIELRNRRRREEWLKHRYFEDSKVIWLDGWSQQAMHVGEEATIAWGYWNKIVDKRLIEQRQKDLQEAIARIAPGFMGKIFRGEDKAEYKDANAVMEAISAAAAKEIGLKESDFEEVLVGQRSLRLKDVQKLPEGGYDRYYVTYQFVERKVEASWIEVGDPTVVGKWIEAGDPITVPDSEFEWLLWGWRYQHEAAILLFASKIVVAVSFAPMALVAFPVLIEAAGGALALTISVAVSEIMYVGGSLYRGKQLTANGFIEAAIEGYLMAVGFRGAGFVGKAILGEAEVLAARSFGQILARWIVAKLVTGILGGAGTAAATQFSHDLIDHVILGKGRWSNPKEYAEKMAVGAACGAVFEIAGPVLQVGMKRALGAAVEAGGSGLAGASKVALIFRANGVTLEAFEQLSEVALEGFQKNMQVLFEPIVVADLVAGFRSQLASVLTEMRSVVLRDVLEAAEIQLSRQGLEGYQTFLRAAAPRMEATAAKDLLDQLAGRPGQLDAFLSAMRLFDDDFVGKLAADGQLAKLARAGTIADFARLPGGRAKLASLYEAFGKSVDELEAYLARGSDAVGADLGAEELSTALARPPKGGKVLRFAVEADADGVKRLFREVEHPDGTKTIERWRSPDEGWKLDETATVGKSAEPPPSVTMERIASKAAQDRIAAIRLEIEKLPDGKQILASIDGQGAVGNAILHDLAVLEGGPSAAELRAVADFLGKGGDGWALSEILARGGLTRRIGEEASKGPRAFGQEAVRRLLEQLPKFDANQARGISIAIRERGFGGAGADAVLDIVKWFGDDANSVFGALADMAPHSRGLGSVIRYLESISQNRNRAAVAQLFAARDLVKEFPGAKLVFEAPIFEQMPDTTDPSILKSVLRREIDIQVVSPLTGAPILDVEIKEIADIGILQLRKHARQQFARDIVRDILGSRKTGRAPMTGIRWLIRKAEIAPTDADVPKALLEIRDIMLQLFDKAQPQYADELAPYLTETEIELARKYVEQQYANLIRFF